jgi:hypothetical protein
LTQNTPQSLVSSDLKLEDDVDSPLAPTAVVLTLKTRPTMASFTQNHQKLENSSKYTQKPPESPFSKRFNWADDAAGLPTVSTDPTKQPRDLSGLRSSSFSKNPFSSLQRRHQKFNKNKSHIFCSIPQHLCHHTFPSSHFLLKPHRYTPPSPNNPLDWHHDPRLFELSRVLRTLGWSHQ